MKINNSLDDNKKLLLIEEHLYNPKKTITDSQIIIIFNHIYQHYVFHVVKNIDDNLVSMNFKIQGLPGTGKKIIANTIRNIDINLNPIFFPNTYCASIRCVTSLINGTTHHQLFNIPTRKVFHKPAKDWKKKKIFKDN